MAILSFNGMVNLAVTTVTQLYPDAILYEAEGTVSTGTTTDPNKVDRLKVVFAVGQEGTVEITSTSWGEFASPVYYDSPIGDCYAIIWPVPMDLPKANALKEQAGYTDPFENVTLRWPMDPQDVHPLFIFGTNPSVPYIFVDVVTGKVFSGN